jgi:hypothetical protein
LLQRQWNRSCFVDPSCTAEKNVAEQTAAQLLEKEQHPSHRLYVCTYLVCVYVRMYVRLCVCIRIRIHVCRCVPTQTCLYIRMCGCMICVLCMYACVRMFYGYDNSNAADDRIATTYSFGENAENFVRRVGMSGGKFDAFLDMFRSDSLHLIILMLVHDSFAIILCHGTVKREIAGLDSGLSMVPTRLLCKLKMLFQKRLCCVLILNVCSDGSNT